MLELIQNPTEEHISQIEPWVKAENKEFDAFTYSWDSF